VITGLANIGKALSAANGLCCGGRPLAGESVYVQFLPHDVILWLSRWPVSVCAPVARRGAANRDAARPRVGGARRRTACVAEVTPAAASELRIEPPHAVLLIKSTALTVVG